MSWRQRALCRGVGPSLFFPLTLTDGDVEAAKRLCGECPVQAPCLEFALATNEGEGVWGGMDWRERRLVRRSRRAQAAVGGSSEAAGEAA